MVTNCNLGRRDEGLVDEIGDENGERFYLPTRNP